ncbi:hypothetical protein [Methanolobus profundi]|uniref:Uncharacterized protein n=1 Tax=Methanolobus profundi TaxID=487685 RepID=A0A1I4UM23_9EURY|nr:hypothetical protein [Methanolobus profundi]SFM89961.1 hypothetical protein SAMN04488696_2782 [Methanolobus profundi]
MKFTISSGPFNVPLVNHVIIVYGESPAEVSWNWELLRSQLYTAFPTLQKCKAYAMAPEFDNGSSMYLENILVFIECGEDTLKNICDELGGKYI